MLIILPPIANLIVDKDTFNKHEITNHNAINHIMTTKPINYITIYE